MLAGCTEEEENSGIRLIEGTASGQTVFADETTTDGDIHFTTDGAWTAEVTEASTKAEGSSVSWVTLDKYSGNAAGEYTMKYQVTDAIGSTATAEMKLIVTK